MSTLEHTIMSANVEETKRLAASLANRAVPGLTVALDGDLGAGKTHFVQGFAEGLAISDVVTSPTFNVMVAYTGGRLPLYHFDLYRLENPSELEDIAFYDYVDSDGASCIEWARKFEDDIPADALWVSITTADEGLRQLTLRASGARSEDLLRAWTASFDEAL